MHFVVRALCLFVGGLMAVAASLLLALIFDRGAYYLELHWTRIFTLPIFKLVFVSTMLSMLFPASYYGMNVLSKNNLSLGGWGQSPLFVIFLFTGLFIIPLMVIFSPDRAFFQVFSREAYVLSFILLWWAHGTINAYHVHLLLRDVTDDR